MKKLSLMLAMGALAVFTACGDDSSSSPAPSQNKDDGSSSGSPSGKTVSCMFESTSEFAGITITTKMCGEGPYSEDFEENCQSFDMDGITMEATKGTGCPSGALKSCPDEDGMLYVYDELSASLSCEELLEDDEF